MAQMKQLVYDVLDFRYMVNAFAIIIVYNNFSSFKSTTS